MKYIVTMAEVTNATRPLSVVWSAELLNDDGSHSSFAGPCALSEWRGYDGDPTTPHHSPAAASILAAARVDDLAEIVRAIHVDIERVIRELAASAKKPSSCLLDLVAPEHRPAPTPVEIHAEEAIDHA